MGKKETHNALHEKGWQKAAEEMKILNSNPAQTTRQQAMDILIKASPDAETQMTETRVDKKTFMFSHNDLASVYRSGL